MTSGRQSKEHICYMSRTSGGHSKEHIRYISRTSGRQSKEHICYLPRTSGRQSKERICYILRTSGRQSKEQHWLHFCWLFRIDQLPINTDKWTTTRTQLNLPFYTTARTHLLLNPNNDENSTEPSSSTRQQELTCFSIRTTTKTQLSLLFNSENWTKRTHLPFNPDTFTTTRTHLFFNPDTFTTTRTHLPFNPDTCTITRTHLPVNSDNRTPTGTTLDLDSDNCATRTYRPTQLLDNKPDKCIPTNQSSAWQQTRQLHNNKPVICLTTNRTIA